MAKYDPCKFHRAVYAIVAAIPRGKVLSYGDVARLSGWPQHSRSVGRILGRTDDSTEQPCHRVVGSLGRTAPHWPGQRTLLESEGVGFRRNGCVDMMRYRWLFFKE